jgi:type III restriction enzyme
MRKAAAKVVPPNAEDFAFFRALWQFYEMNRRAMRPFYKELTKKILDFNNPQTNPKAFLRTPQFEALEMYVFLKEGLGNARVELIFEDWYAKRGRFAARSDGGVAGDSPQADLFLALTESDSKRVFQRMRANARSYPNYIFALTMGTGKTILMATCIFYEFLLGNKHPKEQQFCLNALVFAPDKTVLHSLKEIEHFGFERVVPPEYVSFITAHLRFHYLDEAGTALATTDQSRFNIVVSNTQKVILKRIRAEKSAIDQIFGAGKPTFDAGSVFDQASDLYNFDAPEDDAELTTNQRFQKLQRLEQLGIYVDEAHHAFGKALAKDMGIDAKPTDTSLRTTIDKLAQSLHAAGTRVVGCYNFTGTPYVGRDVLPEVVYAYGLREAIDKQYLKRVRLFGYQNTRSDEFVDIAIESFLRETSGLRPENMLPKMAFFAATIDELTTELKPAVERALAKHGISAERILINVGDEKLTSNDDIRDFNQLDTPQSGKQFILLVNKGREGWNCRSLFSVALFRSPKSRIFVLQATMRCLRAIGTGQHTGLVYLSDENLGILNDELLQNFRISAEDVQRPGTDKIRIKIKVVEDIENDKPMRIKLRRVRRVFEQIALEPRAGTPLGLDPADKQNWANLTDRYKLIEVEQSGITAQDARAVKAKRDLTARRQHINYSPLMLVAEVARYLNIDPLRAENLIESTHEQIAGVLTAINTFNELLFDIVIPRLFGMMFHLKSSEHSEEHDVDLVKIPKLGYFEMSVKKENLALMADAELAAQAKSFHLDAYHFDSTPEREVFWELVRSGRVKRVYFTGMLTHGQSDFYVQYIDPEAHIIRNYYPDFIYEKADGGYVILEVKADNQIDTPVVQAKTEFAQRMAVASGMRYEILRASMPAKEMVAQLVGDLTDR